MKKRLLLCVMLFGIMHAQDVSSELEKVSQIEEDLDTLISPEDENDTIGDVIGAPSTPQETVMPEAPVQAPEEEKPEVQEMEMDITTPDKKKVSTVELEQELDEMFVEGEPDGEPSGQEEAESMASEEDQNNDEVVKGFLKESKKLKKPAAEPEELAGTPTLNLDKKRKEVVALVERAEQELINSPLDVACNRFTHTKEYIKGDLYVYVFDMSGTCLAHGEDSYLLWKNLYDLKDWVGTPIIQNLIKKAKEGGGWVTYGWHNATKVSYVQLVEKEGNTYVIGSGFFPHSKEESVVNLVKGGVALFNKVKQEGKPADWAFGRLSYPSGQFAVGNLYLYALDFEGNIMAQGDRPGLIGSNAWDYKDENGLYVNREIVKKLKTVEKEGVWVEYISKRATKKAYAEKVKEKDGTQYFIACGYYPDANREQTIDLVRKAYQYMKTQGKSNAVEEFSSRRNDDFRYGDLYIVVYDMKGKIIADGSNADNIGQSMLDAKDQDGFEYVKNILKRASKQGIWVNAKIRGSFQSTYAQLIDIGVGQYVIASSYYPISKSETMILLVQSGASYLKANPRERVFEKMVQQNGQFRRGDLELLVVDAAGLCYAYGDDYDLIWRNIYNIKDESGKPFIQQFINESRYGSVSLTTHMNNSTKYNYVTSVQKKGKTYIIASGYYE